MYDELARLTKARDDAQTAQNVASSRLTIISDRLQALDCLVASRRQAPSPLGYLEDSERVEYQRLVEDHQESSERLRNLSRNTTSQAAKLRQLLANFSKLGAKPDPMTLDGLLSLRMPVKLGDKWVEGSRTAHVKIGAADIALT